MGHQVNFYLTPLDLQALERVLRGVEPLFVLHSRSHTSKPLILEALDLLEQGQPWLYFFLVRPDDVGSVVMRHVPAQGYWTVDVVKSPVIEFSRCFMGDHLLRRGRLYFLDTFYGVDGALVRKSDRFQKWAKSLFCTTKKCLKKTGAEYLGEDAERWLLAGGGELAQ